MQTNSGSKLKILVFVLFGATWLLMCGANVREFMNSLAQAFAGVDDIARRVTAPDGSKTAILVRGYGFDLNFGLKIIDGQASNLSIPDLGAASALWWSSDYEPTTAYNWHEDIEWSKDSAIIAVTIQGQYVFAHDFKSDQSAKDPVQIQKMLGVQSTSPLTYTYERRCAPQVYRPPD